MGNKIVFGNWEPIELKSWTYSTTEDGLIIESDTFESLLDQHCQKSDIKVYFRSHEIYKVYKHEYNLYFMLKEDSVSVYSPSSLSGVITNMDWLFSFSEPARLKAFLESLPLDEL